MVVVEDDNDVAFLLTHKLRRERDLDAIHVASPHAAMETDLWTYDKPDHAVGVLDLMMPEASGVEVAQWVKDNMGGIRLIALSALVHTDQTGRPVPPDEQPDDMVRDAYEIFDVVLAKPVDWPALIGAIRGG